MKTCKTQILLHLLYQIFLILFTPGVPTSNQACHCLHIWLVMIFKSGMTLSKHQECHLQCTRHVIYNTSGILLSFHQACYHLHFRHLIIFTSGSHSLHIRLLILFHQTCHCLYIKHVNNITLCLNIKKTYLTHLTFSIYTSKLLVFLKKLTLNITLYSNTFTFLIIRISVFVYKVNPKNIDQHKSLSELVAEIQ